MSSKISKPSPAEAKELSRLFPNSFKSGSSGTKRKFDPNDSSLNCIVPDKCKKKKSATSSGRPVKMQVCRLSSLTSSIPKGKKRALLKTEGRLVDVYITRSLSSDKIKAAINRAFHHLSCEWDYLECGQDHQLSLLEDQSPSGDVLCNKRGCIYIVDREVSYNTKCMISAHFI